MATLAAASLASPRVGADRNEDELLVASVRAGDDHAFEQLYLRYQRRIAAYVFGMVHDHGRAEDITQDVFMSALRRMRATDGRIIFKPWVYEIAKNACIDAFRRSRRAEEISYDGDDGGDRLHLVSNGPTPDAAVDTRMSLDHLRGAFGGLSEAHHQILVMRELEGLSYRQIGERLGMSRPSVESTLFRARKRLSEEYEELVSGERCQRIQTMIAGATDAQLGTRDERKMARHVSYCQPCRRAALVAGFDPDALVPKRSVREKIAALLPLPAFLKRRIAGPGGGDGSTWIAAAQYAEPAGGGWVKLAVTASAVVLAGMGAHTVRSTGDDKPAGGSSPDAAAVRSAPAAGAGGSKKTVISAGSTAKYGSSQSSGSTKSSGGAGSQSGGAGSPAGSQQGSGPSSSTPSSAADASGSSGGGGSGSDPVKDLTRSVTGTVGGVGSQTSAPEVPTAQLPKVELPTVQVPNVPGAPKVVNDTVDSVNNTVGQVTTTVNQTVGQATDTVNNTVGQTTTTVNQTVGGATGAVGGTTQGVGDTVRGVTGGTGLLGGG
jgi:RNA polymerase sigma factor (sigma-70 family)